MPRIVRAAIAVAVALAWSPAGRSDQGERSGASRICGPRVTEFVLNWYGHLDEAVDLVAELQQGRADQFVSIGAVAAALEARGLHTLALRLGRPGVVDWHGPVVYHTTTVNGGGHFVVGVPPRDGLPRLFWCNSRGFDGRLPADYESGLTGVVLLVSDHPIADTATLSEQGTTGSVPWRWVWVSALALVAVVAACRVARRGRGNPA